MHPESDKFASSAQQSFFRYSSWFLAGLALIYGFFSGFHNLQDFDLGWQLATGRWVAQHHYVFSTDVFSYTAAGQPWIYPVLSGLIFYAGSLAGGYALLCWMGALASVGTILLLLRRHSPASAAFALIAVPLIANRTQPRAEMFTVVLFAAFLKLLWKQHRTGRGPLWLLPLLMVFWVNLHLGFIAGLALCLAYIVVEALDFSIAEKRSAAMLRLRRASRWLALTPLATILNPWGLSIYSALVRQEHAQSLHNLWIVEWGSIHPSWDSLRQAIDVRDPQSAFWWLLIIGFLALLIAAWRREWGTALLLGGVIYVAFQHARFHALFACVIILVGSSVITDFAKSLVLTYKAQPTKPRFLVPAAAILTAALTALAGVRVWDLASNRYYMRSSQLALFGTGLSCWFPERAVDFIQREKLPANIFNGYTLGGFLDWRLFPAYQVYIDSRAVPFGRDLFLRAYDLSTEPPDSRAWQHETESRGINTIIVPLSRYSGMTIFPQLHAFCRSHSWSPVYLDDVSAVFLRRTPFTESLIHKLQINCDTFSFPLPASLDAARKDRAGLFNAWANAGGILYSLERYPEALRYLDRAESVFTENANVHFLRALVLQQLNRAVEAEAEFRASLSLEPNDQILFDFGLFYMTQRRYADAAEIFQRGAESSGRPHEMWMMLGQAELQMHQPKPALDDFAKADASSPFHEKDALGASFNSLLATGRAKACYQLGDLAQAIGFQEDAVRLAPNDAKLWLGLADLYDAVGRTSDAAHARMRAAQP